LERFIQLTNELKTGDPTQADNFLGAVNRLGNIGIKVHKTE